MEFDPVQLKIGGNYHFKHHRYLFAIRWYTEALLNLEMLRNLQVQSPDLNALNGQLLSNRAQCYLKIERDLEAVEDAEKALEFAPQSYKIYFRLATALENTSDHGRALQVLNEIDVRKVQPKSVQREFVRLSERVRRRQFQSSKWRHGHGLGTRNWDEAQDIDNFYSTSINIKYISNKKGRGVVATADIQKGEVVLSEKCIASGDVNISKMCSVLDHRTMIMYWPSTLNLINNIVDTFRDGTDVKKYMIALLHKGDSYHRKKTVVPKMSMFRVSRLPKHVKEVHVLNADQIKFIAEKNAFNMPTNERQQEQYLAEMQAWRQSGGQSDIAEVTCKTGSGLFIAASFFNHSNNNNIHWEVGWKRIHMIALRDVKRGEELCIKYHNTKDVAHWFD